MRRLLRNLSISQSILIMMILVTMLSLTTISISTVFTNQNTTSEIVEESSKEINKQIILNFDNYIESVINTVNYIQQKTLEYGLKDDNDSLTGIYREASDVVTDIESIVLIDITGNFVISSNLKNPSLDDITKKDWYASAISDDSIYHFSSPHIQDIFDSSSAEVITVTKITEYYSNGIKYRGILVVDLNFSSIITLAGTTNLGSGGHLIILDDDGSLIYSDKLDCSDNECSTLNIAEDIIFGGRIIEVEGVSMYANVNLLTDTRWRLATFINIDIIDQTMKSNLIIIGAILSATLLVTLLSSTYISNRISSPIKELKDHMQKIEQGDYYQKIDISGQKEVIVLAQSFNSMIEEIKSLMEKVIVEQKAKRKTEFRALQNQINPHFLYNTLDSIVYLSENKMNEEVIKMVVALSRFFRISISRGKNIILLKEEIEHAKNYLLIQQIRYDEKFSFEFDIDEEVLDFKVVKLSLQPIIENAIYHGIDTENDSGKVVIRAFKQNDNLILEVEDDGYGITKEKIEEMYQSIMFESDSKSVGLRNVYQRLKIYHGDDVEFIIDSELDEKTIVRLVIPMKRDENYE